MAQDAEISITPVAPLAPSGAAMRMRNSGARRREGLRCVTIELRETEIDVLVAKGLLKADARNDVFAVREALYSHFEATLKA